MISGQDLNDHILREDAINLLCGNMIGDSECRKVFDCHLMPGWVVKVEQSPASFRNIEEFKVWEAVMGTEHAKNFAEIHSMSHNGRLLIMRKTEKPGPNDWPTHMPVYMTDFKRVNYGMLVDTNLKTGKKSTRFVAHDYSHHYLMERGLSKRVEKVKWLDCL